MSLLPLNFHHLQYFWAVARDGNLTRTARELRIAPSALSSQIRQLEEQVGQVLFDRIGRGGDRLQRPEFSADDQPGRLELGQHPTPALEETAKGYWKLLGLYLQQLKNSFHQTFNPTRYALPTV